MVELRYRSTRTWAQIAEPRRPSNRAWTQVAELCCPAPEFVERAHAALKKMLQTGQRLTTGVGRTQGTPQNP